MEKQKLISHISLLVPFAQARGNCEKKCEKKCARKLAFAGNKVVLLFACSDKKPKGFGKLGALMENGDFPTRSDL